MYVSCLNLMIKIQQFGILVQPGACLLIGPEKGSANSIDKALTAQFLVLPGVFQISGHFGSRQGAMFVQAS
jgi:hypothetical protein